MQAATALLALVLSAPGALPPSPPPGPGAARVFITGNVVALADLEAGKPNDITTYLGKHCINVAVVDGKEKSDYVVLLTTTFGPLHKTTSYLLFTKDGEPLGGDTPVALEDAIRLSCDGIRRHRAGERLSAPVFPGLASMPSRPPAPTASPALSPPPVASPVPSPRPR